MGFQDEIRIVIQIIEMIPAVNAGNVGTDHKRVRVFDLDRDFGQRVAARIGDGA